MNDLEWKARSWPWWRWVIAVLSFVLAIVGIVAQFFQAQYSLDAGDGGRALAIYLTLGVVIPAAVVLIIWYYRRQKRRIIESRHLTDDDSMPTF